MAADTDALQFRQTQPLQKSVNLRKLFVDVFDPEPGETAAVLVDLPHGKWPDKSAWVSRRAMAERWHAALAEFGADKNFKVLPLLNFEATGMNNGQLPASGTMGGMPVLLEEIGARTTLLLAMTEFSATAPLIGWSKRFPQLRAASMPRVAPEMEATALAADYAQVARSCGRLRERLEKAQSAEIEFSTGDEFVFDYRFRTPEMDDGYLHRDAPVPRLINLPSGEAFTTAYEGERGVPSLTSGVLPLSYGNEIVRVRVQGNRAEEIIGETAGSRKLRHFLSADPARSRRRDARSGRARCAVRPFHLRGHFPRPAPSDYTQGQAPRRCTGPDRRKENRAASASRRFRR